jgi:hypothetical protein
MRRTFELEKGLDSGHLSTCTRTLTSIKEPEGHPMVNFSPSPLPSWAVTDAAPNHWLPSFAACTRSFTGPCRPCLALLHRRRPAVVYSHQEPPPEGKCHCRQLNPPPPMPQILLRWVPTSPRTSKTKPRWISSITAWDRAQPSLRQWCHHAQPMPVTILSAM